MVAPQDSSRIKKSLVSEMASRFVDMSIDEFVAEKDTNLTKVKIDSPAVDVKVTLKSGTLIEFKASKTLAGYAYTKHPTRQELIKLSAWRFDAFKKKPFELLDAPPVVIDTNKSAAKLVVPSKPNAPIKVEKFPNVKPSGPKPAK